MSKTIKAGPFSWNIGGYLGGTHHGNVTSRTSANVDGFGYVKNKTLYKPDTSSDVLDEFLSEETNTSLNQVFDIDPNALTEELSYEPKYTKTTLNLLMIASVAILWLSFIYVNPLMNNLFTSSMQFLIVLVPIFYAKLIKAEDPYFSIVTP